MTLSKSEVLALRGLRLPPVALKAMQRAGIYCQPMVSIEFQKGADRYLIRGVESGGAVPGCGAYCAFADEHGAPPEIIQPIGSVGVNGVHAASLSPVLIRAQVFRSEFHCELLLTRHSLVSTKGKARPALHNSVLFHSKYGVLDAELWSHQCHLRGVIAPTFYARSGEPIAPPDCFHDTILQVTAGVCCVGCRHSHMARLNGLAPEAAGEGAR
jgi:hypothetical protein